MVSSPTAINKLLKKYFEILKETPLFMNMKRLHCSSEANKVLLERMVHNGMTNRNHKSSEH